MRTIVLNKPGNFERIETQAPNEPQAGEITVRVRRIGICGTDLHAFRGKQPFFTYPRILGHELGVEVAAIGEGVEGFLLGDRCAVEPYLNCGACIACRNGKTNCCAHLKVLGVHTDGGMRECINVPANKLHKSETLSWEQLALVETLGIGAHAVQRSQAEKGEFALVIGAGPIGLSVMQFALAAGAQVIALDIIARRLEFCQKQIGVQFAILAENEEATSSKLREITNGDMPTIVFDATGHPESMAKAFRYVAPGGKLVFVGLFQGDYTFNDPDFHRRELTLLATRNSTSRDFQSIIELMEQGTIDTTPWITHRAAFDDMPVQFPLWLDPETGVIKAVIDCD